MKPRAATPSSRKWASYLRLLNWLGTAALALPTLAGLLAGWWWVFELMCHFRVQYAVGCGGLVVATLIIRCWKAASVAAALLIVNLCLIVPLYFPPLPAGNRPAQLRLMTLNVHSANRRYQRVRELIRDESPDVVCVLEFSDDWQDALAQIRAEYCFTQLAPRSGNFGIAVYSRRSLGEVTLRELGEERVPVIRASLAVGGRDVALYAVHVFPPVSRRAAAWRNQQLRGIGQQVRREGGPVVVTGDLNCTSWSPFFRRLLAETGLRDSRRGYGVQATWPTRTPWMLIPIDHCLVSPGLEVVGRHVTDACGSDHLGIVVDLRAGG